MTAAFELILCSMMLGTACVALLVRDFLAAIAFFVVFGNLMGLAWLAMGAVNVALAEIAIGAGVTGVLLVLTRSRLLALGEEISSASPGRWLTLSAAALCSVLAAVLGAAVLLIAPDDGLAPVIDGLMPLIGVENPVTGVLLAFRAYDTLLESFVLLGALVAVWSLAPPGAWPRAPAALRMTDPAALNVAESFGRLLLPVALVAAAYLVWVGSDRPGGAFQGGTVLAGGFLLAALGGAVGLPRSDDPALRWVLVAGPLVFLAIGLAGLALGRFLAYPEGMAKALIVTIEYVLAFSIGGTLALLVAGPPALPETRP